MKPYYLLIIPFFIGCSVSNSSTNVKNFAKCYIHKIPAPFWVCYQSSFQSVGKVITKKPDRIKQEEAYSIGVTDLVSKLQAKTKLFLRRVGIDDEKEISNILEAVKNFVLVSAIEEDNWYSKKDKIFYVKVGVDRHDFKKFLFSKLKNVDKKTLNIAFDEIF